MKETEVQIVGRHSVLMGWTLNVASPVAQLVKDRRSAGAPGCDSWGWEDSLSMGHSSVLTWEWDSI